MIGFAGLTHLGLMASLAAAVKGFDVVAVDPQRCSSSVNLWDELREPGVRELAQSSQARIMASSNLVLLRQCSLIFVSLDVPVDENGHSDLASFNELVSQVLDHLAPDAALVVLSQVPPGTTRGWADTIFRRRPSASASIYYQVETLIVGASVERALAPERIIVGSSDPRHPLPAEYQRYLDAFACPILTMPYESAELCKLAINCFLISSITTTNHLAAICEALGTSWSDIAAALRMDRRIGPHAYLNPGLGLGGTNLIRDLAVVKQLADRHGVDRSLADAWLISSRYHRDWALRRLHEEVLTNNPRPLIALWGLAYKPGTDSTANSPALAVLDAIPNVTVQAYDPEAAPPGSHPHLVMTSSPLEACWEADVLLVMTPWPIFTAVSLRRVHQVMRNRVIIDPFGALSHDETAQLGFRHLVLGAPRSALEAIG